MKVFDSNIIQFFSLTLNQNTYHLIIHIFFLSKLNLNSNLSFVFHLYYFLKYHYNIIILIKFLHHARLFHNFSNFLESSIYFRIIYFQSLNHQ